MLSFEDRSVTTPWEDTQSCVESIIGKQARCNLRMQRVLPISSTSSLLNHTAIGHIKGALTLTKPGIQHFTGR